MTRRGNKWWAFGERVLPVVALVPASMALGWLAWRLFFRCSAWLWARQAPVDLKAMTRWALPQFGDADGAEPVALIGLVVVVTAMLSALAYLLPRANRGVQAAVTLLSMLGAYFLLQRAQFVLPLEEVGPFRERNLAIVLGAVAASLLIGWEPRRSHALAIFTALLPFLLCFFLALDLWLLHFRSGSAAPRALEMTLALGPVTLCAWQYSGRVWTKLATQMAVVNRSELIGPLFVPQFSAMYCDEVERAAPNRKVYFFAALDSWFYARCGYRPPSYRQPVGMSIVKAPLVAEISHLLDRGFTIAMYKADSMVTCFAEDYQAEVAGSGLIRTDSAHWTFVTRGTKPPPPLRRQVRPRRRMRVRAK